MIKKFYGALVVTSLLVSTAYGYNYKLLDLEADAFVSKLCSGTPIKQARVKESLELLKPKKDVGSKYSSPRFEDDLIAQMKDDKFSRFAATCKNVSTEGDESARIAANLLLERVSEKYGSFLKQVQRVHTRPVDSSQGYTSSISFPDLLRIFATADKNMGLIQEEQR